MSAFDDDFAAVDTMFAEAFGVAVSYIRGATVLSVTAEVDSHSYDVGSEDVSRIIGQPRSFRIPVASLSIGGTPITPRNGDVITQTIGVVVEQFEVMASGDRPAAERVDPDWADWLVHTKYVGAVA